MYLFIYYLKWDTFSVIPFVFPFLLTPEVSHMHYSDAYFGSAASLYYLFNHSMWVCLKFDA